jgi:UDPglucose 6-dehydrogenase
MNDHQKQRFVNRMVRTMFNTVSDKKIAIWGFAFKKDTNDIRESAAIYVCRDLLLEKAKLAIYDPQVKPEQIREAMEYVMQDENGDLNASKRQLIEENIQFAQSGAEAADDAHAIALLTEWDEFSESDFASIQAKMKQPAFVFDGRNLLKHAKLNEKGFRYFGIGF